MDKPSRETIKKILEASIKQLRFDDKDLFATNANERSITHRLAVYLERHLRETIQDHPYHVDCEYNRSGSDVKRLPGLDPVNPDSVVLPDIVVHVRRSKTDNLLIVECKRNHLDSAAVQRDKERLKAFQRGQYVYSHAAFVDLSKVGDEIDFGPHE